MCLGQVFKVATSQPDRWIRLKTGTEDCGTEVVEALGGKGSFIPAQSWKRDIPWLILELYYLDGQFMKGCSLHLPWSCHLHPSDSKWHGAVG